MGASISRSSSASSSAGRSRRAHSPTPPGGTRLFPIFHVGRKRSRSEVKAAVKSPTKERGRAYTSETSDEPIVRQHYVLEAVIGSGYVSPIEHPRRILDIGAHSLMWMLDLAKEFHRSQITGIGLRPLRADTSLPVNCSFEIVDLYDDPRLPFPNAYFDFVRHRILNVPVRPENQQAYISECARVTAPSGWVELAQWQGFCEYAGPAAARWHEWFLRAMETRIADTYYIDQVEELMRTAGLEEVQRKEYLIPVGAWAGSAGQLSWTNIEDGTILIAEELARVHGVPKQMICELLPQMQQEVSEHRGCFSFVVYFGRKPDISY
ncbi:hypothetical protein THASP1DRAFT_29773 [Thamnocephalis sphaerospora]|uniref:S-adenosyl-L-methionine-dependent methyltransferase n=1 Tax=Thamnocephalis sphaerospora TaxID=78915 RepID=A0A4P9XQU5_9FUNG|nr:hypothetical protein THASP1DRAFT_29773 [Thamnocephalis sphaerospora]|eukprot:RKP08415.1 hypothetical protein THASP1DRAFT_29773 [Thamnocephalis sphaerospora]